MAAARGGAESGPVLRVGLGASAGGAEVTGKNAHKSGIILNVQAGVSRERFCFLLDLEAQPYRVPNPVMGEAFRVAYLLPSVRVNAQRVFLRAGIGLSYFSFSGPEAFESSSLGPAFGVSAGYEVLNGRLPVAVEGVGRWGATSDGELSSRTIGLQVVGSWIARR